MRRIWLRLTWMPASLAAWASALSVLWAEPSSSRATIVPSAGVSTCPGGVCLAKARIRLYSPTFRSFFREFRRQAILHCRVINKLYFANPHCKRSYEKCKGKLRNVGRISFGFITLLRTNLGDTLMRSFFVRCCVAWDHAVARASRENSTSSTSCSDAPFMT